jgi:replicative DNA helicase
MISTDHTQLPPDPPAMVTSDPAMVASDSALLLPSHAQGESHLLSSILAHGRIVAEQVAPLLTDADFHFAKHRVIYGACMKVFGEGHEVVPETVAEVLSRQGSMASGIGIEELRRLASFAPSSRGALPMAKLLMGYRARRDIIAACQRAALIAADMTTDQDTVLSQSVALVQQAAIGSTSTSRTESAPTIGSRVLAEVAARRIGGCEILGIPTGLRAWDLQVNGIVPRKLNTVAGATGMGKTAALLTMADGTTSADSPAIIFSLEMENDALWHRCLAMHSHVDSRRIATGQVDDGEWARIESANRYWTSKPIEFNDWAGMTVRDIEGATREFVARVRGKLPPVVYIDFAQIIADLDPRNLNEASKIQKNVYALREMAKNMNLGLVLMAQLNRNVDSREDKRPRLSDIADSAGVAKASDTITMLYRPAYYAAPNQEEGAPPTDSKSQEAEILSSRYKLTPPDEAEWSVEKGRDGGRRTLKMTYHPTLTKFTSGGIDYAHEAAQSPQPTNQKPQATRKANF